MGLELGLCSVGIFGGFVVVVLSPVGVGVRGFYTFGLTN